MLQNHLGQGALHEVGIHGVGRQHCLVGIHTRPKSPIQLHQRPAAQALQATGTASEEAEAMAAAEAHTNLAPTPLDSQIVQLMHSHQQPEEGLVGGYLANAF
ncbi:MAG: hypothetical protein FRX49_00709 [Trebouxia sp. A1-2]|nr:MAG: hypothetical protein FRX49_00709 [Trebouxia sp. A1-2]